MTNIWRGSILSIRFYWFPCSLNKAKVIASIILILPEPIMSYKKSYSLLAIKRYPDDMKLWLNILYHIIIFLIPCNYVIVYFPKLRSNGSRFLSEFLGLPKVIFPSWQVKLDILTLMPLVVSFTPHCLYQKGFIIS